MYTGIILDPINGIIRVSEIEKWVISQKEFRNYAFSLRNILLF